MNWSTTIKWHVKSVSRFFVIVLENNLLSKWCAISYPLNKYIKVTSVAFIVKQRLFMTAMRAMVKLKKKQSKNLAN